jgi:hypothetical protein
MCGAMSIIYIPPGHIWLIEAAVVMAYLLHPKRWASEKMLPGEAELWDDIVTGRYKPEFIHTHLSYRFPNVNWAVPSPETSRYFAYDEALQLLRTFIAEGIIRAYFIDDAGKIDHIKGEGMRLEAGEWIVAQGYALLTDSPKIPRYLFVSEDRVIAALSTHMKLEEISAQAAFRNLRSIVGKDNPESLHDEAPQKQTSNPSTTSQDRRSGIVKRRRDHIKGDEQLQRGLRSMGVLINLWRSTNKLPGSARALARALLNKEPDLRERVGDVETVRKIIGGTHTRSNRLAEQGIIKPWWPVDLPNNGSDGED